MKTPASPYFAIPSFAPTNQWGEMPSGKWWQMHIHKTALKATDCIYPSLPSGTGWSAHGPITFPHGLQE